MSAPARDAARDYSKGDSASPRGFPLSNRARWALLLAAVAGGLMLVAAEFSTLAEMQVGSTRVVQETKEGIDQHYFALGLLGLAALPLAWGALNGQSRPAMVALLVVGLLALLIVLVGDLDDVRRTGELGRNFEDARAVPKRGFYLETAGSVLLVATAGSLLVLTAPGRRSAQARRPRTREAPTEE